MPDFDRLFPSNAVLPDNRILDQFPAVFWTTDCDLRFTSSHGAGLAALGLKPGEVVGLTLDEFFKGTEIKYLAQHRRVVAGESFTYEQTVMGRTFQSHVQPLRSGDGAIIGTIGVALDITGRKLAEQRIIDAREELEVRVGQRTAELQAANAALADEVRRRASVVEALLASEQRLSGILNSQTTFVARAGFDGKITYLNHAYAAKTGLRVGDEFEKTVHPEDRGVAARIARALSQAPYTCEVETRSRIDGQWRWIHWQNSVIRARDGKLSEIQGVGFDITARRQAEEALRKSEEHFRGLAQSNRRLLNELDHRVHNNLAGLLSLVQLMRGHAGTVAEFADAMEARLLAMARIHQLLAESEWRPIDLPVLVRTLLGAVQKLAACQEGIEIIGDSVLIDASHSPTLAMILLEWFTNSCKYGALSVPKGKLVVSWNVATVNGVRTLRLRWIETNGPPPRLPIRESLGTELIRGFSTRELGGQVLLNYPPAGAAHELTFPLVEQHEEAR